MIDFTNLDLTIDSMTPENLLETSLFNTEFSGLGFLCLEISAKYKINSIYLCAHLLYETNAKNKKSPKNSNLFNIKEALSNVILETTKNRQFIEIIGQLISLALFKNKNGRTLKTICKYYSFDDKWLIDINIMMNKIILSYEKINYN